MALAEENGRTYENTGWDASNVPVSHRFCVPAMKRGWKTAQGNPGTTGIAAS